ncbi:MAG: response regulator [Geobacter sp.]|nr:response regulator [Geobacter sp.]
MTARILLAEDNGPLAAALERLLTSRGFAVLMAENGVEALRKFAGGGIDLLVLDLRLPGLNGIEVLRKIRLTPAGAKLPVIIMTGVYRGEKYALAARRLGVEHYLEKPFRTDTLLEAVTSALRGASSPPSPLEQLIAIYHQGKSGTFTIAGHPPIVILNGEPLTFVSRGRREFPLFLATRGKLPRERVDILSQSGEEHLFLTRTGLLTYDDLAEESRQFLTQLLASVLDTDGGSEFTDALPKLEPPLTPLCLPRLLYEANRGLSSRFDWETFLERNGAYYPARTPLFYWQANFISMREEDIRLLARVNGKTTLAELTGSGDRHGAALFFRFLHALGMIELAPAPTEEASPDFPLEYQFNRPLEAESASQESPVQFDDLVEEMAGKVDLEVQGMDAPLSSAEIGFEQAVLRDYSQLNEKNYYEIFGLTQGDFSFQALKEAYFDATRRYDPEKFMELAGNVQAMAQEILSVYAHAYNTLSNVVAKERYDELLNSEKVGLGGQQDDALQAQIQFQSGKVFLDMGEYENAEKALNDAYTLEPDDPDHCAFLAWAIYRNPANRSSQTAREKARGLLVKAMQYGKISETFSFRGWMLLDEGRDGLAEGEFQKALRTNPGDRLAQKGLRQIAEQREGEKRGLLKRFFG